jgi:hypothetical protein
LKVAVGPTIFAPILEDGRRQGQGEWLAAELGCHAMSVDADIQIQTTTIGRMHADGSEIRGDKESVSPALIIPVGLDLYSLDGQKLVVERLEAALWTMPTTGPRLRIGSAVRDSTVGQQGVWISMRQGERPYSIDLRFDLFQEGLWALDRHVQQTTGPFVSLSLICEARVAWVREQLNPPDTDSGTVLDLLPFWRPRINELQVRLPREHWARQVAPALGHDRVRLIAVQLPSPDGVLGNDVVPIFDAANRAYDVADWRECIQKCRDVRHHIEQQVHGTSQDGTVAQIVAQRLSVEEGDPRVRFLDSTWKALADVTNEAHHIDSIGRLQAATAHAALLVTATMVQHVAELLGPA